MEITGRIITVLDARSGTNAKGTWMSQSYVLEFTEGQYARHICFNVWGEDTIKKFAINEGDFYKVSFDIDAHEYQGRWYNEVRAWKVETASAPTSPVQQAKEEPKAAPVDFTPDKNEGELPF